MKRYPLAYNPILEYWQKIESGEEVVSRKVRKTYAHIVERLHKPEGEFFYSPQRANHIIEYFENFCHHSKGKMGGKLVKLELGEPTVPRGFAHCR